MKFIDKCWSDVFSLFFILIIRNMALSIELIVLNASISYEGSLLVLPRHRARRGDVASRYALGGTPAVQTLVAGAREEPERSAMVQQGCEAQFHYHQGEPPRTLSSGAEHKYGCAQLPLVSWLPQGLLPQLSSTT